MQHRSFKFYVSGPIGRRSRMQIAAWRDAIRNALKRFDQCIIDFTVDDPNERQRTPEEIVAADLDLIASSEAMIVYCDDRTSAGSAMEVVEPRVQLPTLSIPLSRDLVYKALPLPEGTGIDLRENGYYAGFTSRPCEQWNGPFADRPTALIALWQTTRSDALWLGRYGAMSWIRKLQAGDEIGVEYKLGAVLIVKVDRITKAGRIVASGMQFSPVSGKAYGKRARLIQPTDEQRDKVERQKLAGEVKGLIGQFARFDGLERYKIDEASREDLTALRDALIVVRDGKARSR